MRSLFSGLSQDTARAYALVLASMGIPSRTRYNGTCWTVTVAAHHRRGAVRAVSLYLKENPPQPGIPRAAVFYGPKSYSAVYVGAVLVLIHTMIAPGYEYQVFVKAFGADAAQILSGERFRCVTALLLHADWVHLLGNLAALALFGTVTAMLYGWGMGWLLILVCGASGNLLTALWYQQGHLAVGASTAVFGGVGLCAVFNFVLHARGGGCSWRSWLPLAGGLALLGFLGTSPRSDLAAHLFGFICGLFAGGAYLCFRQSRAWPLQLAASAIAVGTIAACWLRGMAYNG